MTKEQLNPEQLSAFNGITNGVKNLLANNKYKTVSLNERIFILSGSSGTGKTTTTSLILKEFQEAEIDALITTPTHKAKGVITDMCDKAGVNFEASTIHSYLGLKVKNNTENGKQELVQSYGNNPPAPYSVLICDEHSQVGKDLLQFILAEVEYDTIGCVIFVGDEYQLLPVGEQEPAVLSLQGTNSYKLNSVMRQALNNPIIEIATLLRDNIISGKYMSNLLIKELFKERLGGHIEQVTDVKGLLSRYFSSEHSANQKSVIAYKNKTVYSLNKKIRDWEIDSDECFIEGEKLIFNSPLVEDDKVVIGNNEIVTLKNLKKIRDEAMDISYWKIIDDEGRVFRVVDFNDRDDFDYELQEIAKQAKKATGSARSAYWARFFELQSTYSNVSYVYSGTTFKAQGSSYDEVFLHLDEILGLRSTIGEENLFRALYVASTRTRDKLVVLVK